MLDVTRLESFAGDKISEALMTISVFDRVENIVGKGENAGNQHFLLFPQCFLPLIHKTIFKISVMFVI